MEVAVVMEAAAGAQWRTETGESSRREAAAASLWLPTS